MQLIKNKDVITVKNDEMAIISSARCDESFCFGVRKNRHFCSFVKSANVDAVKVACKSNNFPTKFLIANTDNGAKYVINAYSKDSVGVKVYEVIVDGKTDLKVECVKFDCFKPLIEDNGLKY